MRLVFQPLPPDMQSAAFAEALREVLGRAPAAVDIAAPYLSAEVLQSLVRGRSFRLITDLDACFEKATDITLLVFLETYLPSIRHVGGLHAKVMLGAERGLFGSANFTRAGLSQRFEVSALVHGPELADLRSWFKAAWTHGQPIESRLADLKQTVAEGVRAASGRSAPRPALPQTGRLGWLEESDVAALNQADLPPATDDPALAAKIAQVAAYLRRWASHPAAAEAALELLALGLTHTGLALDDPRLHLNGWDDTRISVTVGRRYMVWLTRNHMGRFASIILDDPELARAMAQRIPGARQDTFTRPMQPILYIPAHALAEYWPLPAELTASWRGAIEREVARRQASTFHEKRDRAFHALLCQPTARREVVRQAFFEAPPQRRRAPSAGPDKEPGAAPSNAAWWFGVNNNNSKRAHQTLSGIAPLLAGEAHRWPIGRSKVIPADGYRQMRPGDRVLIWAGRQGARPWGLMGIASIAEVNADAVILHEGQRFERPLCPYPPNQPAHTEEVRFLFDVLGDHFAPLGDVRQAVFGSGRTRPITVARIEPGALEAILAWMRQRDG